MKFRNHPQLLYNRRPSWPPVWVESNSLPGTVISGEIGVLTDVILRHSGSCQLLLTINYEARSFSGLLFFDDQPFCLRVSEFLKGCVGRSIKDIGDMSFS